MAEEEYTQLESWEDLIAWLEREGMKAQEDTVTTWNPKPKRKSKKKPPPRGGAFLTRGCRRWLAELVADYKH